jgi:hypothetical protein
LLRWPGLSDYYFQDLVAGIGIAYFERSLISVLLLYSLTYALLYTIRERIIFGSNWPETIILILNSAASISFALAVFVLILRWCAVQRAWKLVIRDKERYDVMWQSMMSTPESREWMAAIQSEVSLHRPSRV